MTALTAYSELSRHNFLDEKTANHADMAKIQARYALRLTPYLWQRIKALGPDSALARQYIPDLREAQDEIGQNPDPIGDDRHSVLPGVVHRYPDRVLLKLHHACPAYCRFCFRRSMVGPQGVAMSEEDFAAACEYIGQNDQIHEVILSGGDPLVLSPRRFKKVMMALEEIPHLDVIRIHSRVPMNDPARINEAFCQALFSQQKAVWIAIHANHIEEFCPEVEAALARLRRYGTTLIGQTVLLRGINDEVDILSQLFRKMVALHIKPYYLHHPDLAPGTAHWRVTIQQGQELMRKLRGKLSGLCQPTYMMDIPGGWGKVPLTPSHIERDHNSLHLIDPQGQRHAYQE